GDDFGEGGSGGGTGYPFDAAPADVAQPDGSNVCANVDYSFANSCSSGTTGDAGDAGRPRSNTAPCTSSFDCAGICCVCPTRVTDAGADVDAAPVPPLP